MAYRDRAADRADAREAGGRGAADGEYLYEPKWDGFRAIVFRGGERRLHPEPRLAPARPLFPRAARWAARAPAEGLRARRRDRHRHPARPRLRRAAAAPASGRVARGEAREGDALLVRRLRRAGRRWTQPDGEPQAERRAALEKLLREAEAPRLSHADDARARPGAALARAFRGRGPGRRDRQAGRPYLPAGQARDDQGEARAHRGMRRRRLPLAQERQGRGRLAAARPLRRRRRAAARRASRHRSRWRCASSS